MPKYIEGLGSIKGLPKMLKEKGAGKVLVVTDPGIMNLGLIDGLFNAFNKENIEYVLYSEVQQNPTSDNVEAAFKIYKDNECQAIVASRKLHFLQDVLLQEVL